MISFFELHQFERPLFKAGLVNAREVQKQEGLIWRGCIHEKGEIREGSQGSQIQDCQMQDCKMQGCQI